MKTHRVKISKSQHEYEFTIGPRGGEALEIPKEKRKCRKDAHAFESEAWRFFDEGQQRRFKQMHIGGKIGLNLSDDVARRIFLTPTF